MVIHDCSPLAVRANECVTYAASRATETGLRVDQPRVHDPCSSEPRSYELYAALRVPRWPVLELPSVLLSASKNAVDAKRGEEACLNFTHNYTGNGLTMEAWSGTTRLTTR